MIYAAVLPTGQILQTGELADATDLPLLAADLGRPVIEAAPGITEDSHYWFDGAFVAFPAAPGDWAVWDWAALSWTDPRDAAWTAARLAEARAIALARITALRGQARLAFITDIPGQEMLYQTKISEALAYVSDPDPVPAEYPLLMSEVGVTAPSAIEVAQVFLNLNAIWRQVAAAIDAACFAAQAAIAATTDAAAMTARVTALEAELTALITIYGGAA